MESLLRYFDMLCLIPKAPNSISTPEILEKLQNIDYVVDLRTVQRDLVKLSASPLFPIASTENTKPLRWFWIDNSSPMQLPLMSTDEALTFKLAEMFLEPLLPPSVRSRLTGYFDLADKRLKESKFEHWVEKVGVVPNNLPLLPAEIEPSVLTVVYEALLKNLRFKATYQAIYKELKIYEINPLGLVFRHNSIYLVATIFDYTDVKQLALHRFKNAELSDRIVFVPKNFVLNDYIAQGNFDYPVDNNLQEITLKLKVANFLKQILLETPLCAQQRMSKIDDEHCLIEADVINTEQLHWWIRSFGTGIEVLEPLELRELFALEAKALNKMYGKFR
ncbi:MAG: WYL domain-containing protein [Methylococcaceae bacterium]